MFTVSKYCPKCKLIKAKSEFYGNKGRQDGLCNYCKPCTLSYNKELLSRPELREKQRSRTRNRYKKDPKIQKWSETYRLYGFTEKDYLLKLDEQGGACAICRGKNLTKGRSYFSIDHCHTQGVVRGLLCDFCNWGLGNFGDDVDKMSSAIEYLKKFKGA